VGAPVARPDLLHGSTLFGSARIADFDEL